jgi:hypothetical protein
MKLDFPFKFIHFRLVPRCRVRYSKGGFNGPRYLLTHRSQMNYSKSPGILAGSSLDTPRNLQRFSERFDAGIKKVFSSDQGIHRIKICSTKNNDPKRGIKGGILTLTG